MSNASVILVLLFVVLSDDVNGAFFFEKATQLGINFQHTDARTGQYQFTETSGSGVGWLDYNNDGWQDLLIINGMGNDHKIYKNSSTGFTDVSAQVLPKLDNAVNFYGMGVCSADVNQDGWVDFILTAAGQDRLYLNNGGDKFMAIALDPTNDRRWSSSCAFGDVDGDGDVDLYVARYVKYDFNSNKSCQNNDIKGYCNPKAYAGENDGLYINDGKGRFTEVSSQRGLHMHNDDRGFGVIISDYDHDGDADIYVANDGGHNRYYLNDGQGQFTDMGLLSGAAINHNGKAEAGMGLAIGDIDRDGFQDLAVSHFSLETNTVYRNHQSQYFIDVTQKWGLSKSSFMPMGWGMALTDMDNDGDEDLLVANGHIHDFIDKLDNRQSYQQPNQLFINVGHFRFAEIISEQAFAVDQHRSSRGLAMADWNNDGRIDVAINNLNDRLTLYENTLDNGHQWLGLQLIGSVTNRSAIGAVVKVISGDQTQRKEIISGGSFMSQSDFRLLFGLADHKDKLDVLIKWPDGVSQKVEIKALNQYHVIRHSMPKN